MITQKNIDDFFSQQNFAIAGVSTDIKKFGNVVYRTLKKKGWKVFAVNPQEETVLGDKSYKNIQSLPDEVKALFVMTSSGKTAGIIQEALEKGIKQIWIQQKSESTEAIALAENNGVNLIYGFCLFMFMRPSSFPHNIHRFFFKGSKKFPR